MRQVRLAEFWRDLCRRVEGARASYAGQAVLGRAQAGIRNRLFCRDQICAAAQFDPSTRRDPGMSSIMKSPPMGGTREFPAHRLRHRCRMKSSAPPELVSGSRLSGWHRLDEITQTPRRCQPSAHSARAVQGDTLAAIEQRCRADEFENPMSAVPVRLR